MKLLMTMRTVLCLANLAFHPARGALLPPTTKVELVSLLSRGGYGEVHFARAPGAAELVAKVARPLDPAEAERAAAYLDAEATANAGVLGCPGICQYLGEASTSEGERCLLFERIRPLGGGEGPATTCADLLRPGLAPPPIAPREVLRQLLVALSHIHRAGYLHRDIKLENVLLGAAAAGPSVKLIDLGSAVSLEGCGLFERMWGGCELDALSTPCSPVYSPPERFADTEHPFAFDVFAAAVCFLRLAWPAALRTEEATEEWRAELAAAGGDLERWLRTRVRATAVPEAWLDSLAAFPAADAAAFAVLRSMLHPDPAFRPSVDAVLAHPFLSPPGCAPAAVTPAPRRTDTDARLLERLLSVECRLPGYAVSERPLSVRVALRRPLGLVLGEVGRADGGGVTIDEILPGGHAAGSALRVGDRLVIVGERSLRGATYEESIAALAAGGRELELLFERSCAGVEGCELPEEIGSPGASAAPAGAAASAGATSPRGAALVVSDSGVFASRGGRTHMEDTSVLTSFSARTPAGLRSFVLAAVFDGHRGGDASAHLRSSLSRATSDALAAGEPSPLAVGWRRVVESYLGTGRQDGSTASAVLVGDDGLVKECVFGKRDSLHAGRSALAFADSHSRWQIHTRVQRVAVTDRPMRRTRCALLLPLTPRDVAPRVSAGGGAQLRRLAVRDQLRLGGGAARDGRPRRGSSRGGAWSEAAAECVG